MFQQLLCVLIVIFKCVNTEQLINNKDYKIIKRLIKNCENDTSIYTCLAYRAIERISSKDIPLVDGIILKKQDDNLTSNVVHIDERGFHGTSGLKKILSRLLDTHYVHLDLTQNNYSDVNETSNEEARRRGGGNRIRISRRERRYFWYSMMVLLGIFGLTGPIFMKTLTLIAGKALIASKIALLMVGSVALKKIFAHDNANKGGIQVHTHTVPISDEHDRFYQVRDEKFYY